MTEAPKILSDEPKQTDLASVVDEQESATAQAHARSQTAPILHQEKYHSLKQRFHALKKEYLALLQNWEESNQRVDQLTQERKFLRDKLQYFLRSSHFHGKVTDEDLALSLLARTSSASSSATGSGTLGIEQLLSLVSLAQQKQTLKPIQVGSSSKAHKNALLLAATAAVEQAAGANGQEFAKPLAMVTANGSTSTKNNNTVTILQKQPSGQGAALNLVAQPGFQNGVPQVQSQNQAHNPAKPSLNGEVLPENGSGQIANGDGKTQGATPTLSTAALFSNPGLAQELIQQQLLVQQMVSQQQNQNSAEANGLLNELLKQQTQAHIAQGKKEQDFVHLNGGGASSSSSKRQKLSSSDAKSSVKIRLNSNQQQIQMTQQLGAALGGILTPAQQQQMLLAQQAAVLNGAQQQQVQPVKKPRKRSEKQINAALAKQQAALNNGIKVSAGDLNKPVVAQAPQAVQASAATGPNGNVSITLPGIHQSIQKQKQTVAQQQLLAQQQQQQWQMASQLQQQQQHGAVNGGVHSNGNDQLQTVDHHVRPQQASEQASMQQQLQKQVHLNMMAKQEVPPSPHQHQQHHLHQQVAAPQQQAQQAVAPLQHQRSYQEQQPHSLMDQLTGGSQANVPQQANNMRQQITIHGNHQIVFNGNGAAPPNGAPMQAQQQQQQQQVNGNTTAVQDAALYATVQGQQPPQFVAATAGQTTAPSVAHFQQN